MKAGDVVVRVSPPAEGSPVSTIQVGGIGIVVGRAGESMIVEDGYPFGQWVAVATKDFEVLHAA